MYIYIYIWSIQFSIPFLSQFISADCILQGPRWEWHCQRHPGLRGLQHGGKHRAVPNLSIVSHSYLVGGLNPSDKYESQLGWLSPIYGKIKHVPNHQPVLFPSVASPLHRCSTSWASKLRVSRCTGCGVMRKSRPHFFSWPQLANAGSEKSAKWCKLSIYTYIYIYIFAYSTLHVLNTYIS